MKDKTITLDGKEMLLVNERISIDQSDVVYVFFDGESTYEIKKSQYDEMSKSGRLVITSTNPYLNY